MRIKLTNELINQAEELIKQGHNLSFVQKELNINLESISKELQKRGYKFRNVPSEEDLKNIYNESISTGISISKLSKKYGFYDDTVSYRLKKMGYQIERGMGSANYCLTDLGLDCLLKEYKAPYLVERIYKMPKAKIDYNPFLNLNSDEVQYWLGYIAADGCITDRGTIGVVSTDKDLIEDYSYFINRNIKIGTTIPKLGKPQYTYRFINKELAAYLIELGLTPRKSMTLKMNIPLSFPFIRGLIDGDGCIHVRSTSSVVVSIVSGSLIFMEQVKSFLEENGISCKIRSNGNLFNLIISSKNNVLNLYRYLYYKSSYYLKRKKDKYACLFS
jgi:intein/homing endonuclease